MNFISTTLNDCHSLTSIVIQPFDDKLLAQRTFNFVSNYVEWDFDFFDFEFSQMNFT